MHNGLLVAIIVFKAEDKQLYKMSHLPDLNNMKKD